VTVNPVLPRPAQPHVSRPRPVPHPRKLGRKRPKRRRGGGKATPHPRARKAPLPPTESDTAPPTTAEPPPTTSKEGTPPVPPQTGPTGVQGQTQAGAERPSGATGNGGPHEPPPPPPPAQPKPVEIPFSKSLNAKLQNGTEPVSVLLFSYEKKVAARLFCAPVPLVGTIAAGISLYEQGIAPSTYRITAATVTTASGGKPEPVAVPEQLPSGPIEPGGVTAFGFTSNRKPAEANVAKVSMVLTTPLGELQLQALVEAQPHPEGGGTCFAEGKVLAPPQPPAS
jgi:hypothetical protein